MPAIQKENDKIKEICPDTHCYVIMNFILLENKTNFVIYKHIAASLNLSKELAQLAPRISSMTMRNIPVQRLGFTEDQVFHFGAEPG